MNPCLGDNIQVNCAAQQYFLFFKNVASQYVLLEKKVKVFHSVKDRRGSKGPPLSRLLTCYKIWLQPSVLLTKRIKSQDQH